MAGHDGALGNYFVLLGQDFYRDVLFRTIQLAVIASAISVILGYAAALAFRYLRARGEGFLILLLTLPILCGPVITVVGWMVILSQGGTVGSVISAPARAFGLGDEAGLLGTDTGLVIGMVHFNLAFVILSLLGSLRQIDRSIEDAAATLGAPPVQRVLRVTLPLSVPGIFSACILAIALSLNAYLTPLFLGNRSRPVLTTQVSQLMLQSFQPQLAAAEAVVLASVLILSLVALVVVFSRSLARAQA